MEEFLHQLRLVVYPTIHRVLAPSQVAVSDFWTINSMKGSKSLTASWVYQRPHCSSLTLAPKQADHIIHSIGWSEILRHQTGVYIKLLAQVDEMSKHSFTIISNYTYTMFSISIVKYDIEWMLYMHIHATWPASFSCPKSSNGFVQKLRTKSPTLSPSRVDKTRSFGISGWFPCHQNRDDFPKIALEISLQISCYYFYG